MASMGSNRASVASLSRRSCFTSWRLHDSTSKLAGGDSSARVACASTKKGNGASESARPLPRQATADDAAVSEASRASHLRHDSVDFLQLAARVVVEQACHEAAPLVAVLQERLAQQAEIDADEVADLRRVRLRPDLCHRAHQLLDVRLNLDEGTRLRAASVPPLDGRLVAAIDGTQAMQNVEKQCTRDGAGIGRQARNETQHTTATRQARTAPTACCTCPRSRSCGRAGRSSPPPRRS